MLFLVSSVLGLVSMASSLLLVGLVLDSPNPGSLFRSWGLPVPYYGKLVTMIYLKVSLSDFLTLFSARTEGPFWSMMPGRFGVGLVREQAVLSGCRAALAAMMAP